ncbi:MAG TPA: hypothetical protein PLY72_20650, partial [Candidatus Obscuribacter sp.]|nr:hypothetical protein [Candidatus Obscuribacter sp.]
ACLVSSESSGQKLKPVIHRPPEQKERRTNSLTVRKMVYGSASLIKFPWPPLADPRDEDYEDKGKAI